MRPQGLLEHAFEKLSDNPEVPPQGYSFVPKGNVYVTRHCRDLTGQAGKTLYVVFDRKTNGRLGLHCPLEILEAVEEDAAASAKQRQQAVSSKDHRDSTHARDLLYQYFPQIPFTSAVEILEHGFLKGSGRVGRSTTLDGEIKMKLAVNAHIRHRFTNYDSLYSGLKATRANGNHKTIARTRVYDEVQGISNSWRAADVQFRGGGTAQSAEVIDSSNEMTEYTGSKQSRVFDGPYTQYLVVSGKLPGAHSGNMIAERPQRQAAITAGLAIQTDQADRITQSREEEILEKALSSMHLAGGARNINPLEYIRRDDEAKHRTLKHSIVHPPKKTDLGAVFGSDDTMDVTSTETNDEKLAGELLTWATNKRAATRPRQREWNNPNPTNLKPQLAMREEMDNPDLMSLATPFDRRMKKPATEPQQVTPSIQEQQNDLLHFEPTSKTLSNDAEDNQQARLQTLRNDPQNKAKAKRRKANRKKLILANVEKYRQDPSVALGRRAKAKVLREIKQQADLEISKNRGNLLSTKKKSKAQTKGMQNIEPRCKKDSNHKQIIKTKAEVKTAGQLQINFAAHDNHPIVLFRDPTTLFPIHEAHAQKLHSGSLRDRPEPTFDAQTPLIDSRFLHERLAPSSNVPYIGEEIKPDALAEDIQWMDIS